MKKVLTLIALIGTALLALLGVLILFAVVRFRSISEVFFSVLSITLSSSLALTPLNAYQRKKDILSILSLSLLGLSVLLINIAIYAVGLSGVYSKFTITVAALSFLFTLIVSIVTKVGKGYFVLQLLTYAVLFIFLVVSYW